MTAWVLLAVSALLVLACAGFVAAEFAFVTVDRSSVEAAAARGDKRARGVRSALERLSTQLSGVQVGITLTNLAIGYLAEPALADLLRGPLTDLGVGAGAVGPTAVALGMALATAGTMVFGELVPKNVAIAAPLGTARAVQGYARGFTRSVKLAIAVLNGSANAIVRRFGVEPQEELRSGRSAEELVSLVRRSAAEGTLDTGTAALMVRSVTFADRTAAEIMTPRVQMSSLSADATVQDLVDLSRSSGHSRFPVTAPTAPTGPADEPGAGGNDDVVGAVHVKHVTTVAPERRGEVPVSEVMVDIPAVPTSVRLDPLMAQLREGGFQMALVVDEYGGTAGIVTLEDVVEEIVGEIDDEHDRAHVRVRRRGEDTWTVSGLLRPDEVRAETGVALPEHEDFDTVAGLVLHEVGRVPEVGATVVVPVTLSDHDPTRDDGPERFVELTVERLQGVRVDRIAMRLLAPEEDDDE